MLKVSALKISFIFLALISFGQLQAQGGKNLAIGDKAPVLSYGKLYAGEPIKAFDPGQIYVVHFWASWCKVCIEKFPELTQLQNRYNGKVRVISINIWERIDNGKSYESAYPKVDRVFAMHKEKIGFTLVADDNKQSMGNWLTENQITFNDEFIIKDNKVVWKGSMLEIEKALNSIIDGTYDIKAFATRYQSGVEEIDSITNQFQKYITAIENAIEERRYADAESALEDAKKNSSIFGTEVVNHFRFKILLRTNESEAIKMAEEEAAARRQSPGGFMQEVSTHDGLRKETYLWAASHFNLTDKLGYTAFKAVAVCYAKGADYRSAVLWQENAVNDIKSRLYSDEVSLRGSVTETMLKDEEKTLNNYKKLQKNTK